MDKDNLIELGPFPVLDENGQVAMNRKAGHPSQQKVDTGEAIPEVVVSEGELAVRRALIPSKKGVVDAKKSG